MCQVEEGEAMGRIHQPQRTKLPLLVMGRALPRNVPTRWRFLSYVSPTVEDSSAKRCDKGIK